MDPDAFLLFSFAGLIDELVFLRHRIDEVEWAQEDLRRTSYKRCILLSGVDVPVSVFTSVGMTRGQGIIIVAVVIVTFF